MALTSLNSTCLESHRKFLLAIIMSKCLLLMKRKKCDFSYDVSSKHVMGMTWWRAAAKTKYWSHIYWFGVWKIQKSRKFTKSRWCQCACCVRNPENQMMIWCPRSQEIYMMIVVGGVRRCSTSCKKLIRNEENGVWSFMIQDQFWWSPFCSSFDCQPHLSDYCLQGKCNKTQMKLRHRHRQKRDT